VLFGRIRFAGQQGLVDEKIAGFEQTPVGRNQIPRGKQDEVSGNEIGTRDRHLSPVAQDPLFERDLHLEMLSGFFCPVLLDGIERGADQHDCRDDDEARQVSGQHSDDARHQQYHYQRVVEPAQELQWQRQAPPLLQRVGAIPGASRDGLGTAEAISTGAKLSLKIGERELPEFLLGPAIGPSAAVAETE